jgi:hypothetical protein
MTSWSTNTLAFDPDYVSASGASEIRSAGVHYQYDNPNEEPLEIILAVVPMWRPEHHKRGVWTELWPADHQGNCRFRGAAATVLGLAAPRPGRIATDEHRQPGRRWKHPTAYSAGMRPARASGPATRVGSAPPAPFAGGPAGRRAVVAAAHPGHPRPGRRLGQQPNAGHGDALGRRRRRVRQRAALCAHPPRRPAGPAQRPEHQPAAAADRVRGRGHHLDPDGWRCRPCSTPAEMVALLASIAVGWPAAG